MPSCEWACWYLHSHAVKDIREDQMRWMKLLEWWMQAQLSQPRRPLQQFEWPERPVVSTIGGPRQECLRVTRTQYLKRAPKERWMKSKQCCMHVVECVGAKLWKGITLHSLFCFGWILFYFYFFIISFSSTKFIGSILLFIF